MDLILRYPSQNKAAEKHKPKTPNPIETHRAQRFPNATPNASAAKVAAKRANLKPAAICGDR
jgi:hypothetical protein